MKPLEIDVAQRQALDEALARCASALHQGIEWEYGAPSRSEVRDRVDALAKAARLVLNAIDGRNPALDPILRRSGALPWEFEGIAMLREVTNRLATYKAENPKRQGRSKPLLAISGQPNARQLCALMVSVHWHNRHDRWPGQRNPEADKLCEMLWRYAGGEAHALHRAELFWRPFLVQARRFRPPHPAGERVSELLSGREQRGASKSLRRR